MKARKTMKNQPLIQEVISQISQRFAPKIPDIKKVTLTPYIGFFTSDQLSFLGYRYFAGEGIYRAGRRHERHIRLCRINFRYLALVFTPFAVPLSCLDVSFRTVAYIINTFVGLLPLASALFCSSLAQH